MVATIETSFGSRKVSNFNFLRHNVGWQPHIPTGGDLQDSCRVNHITVELWDSVDVQGFIELLLRRLNASLMLSSVESEAVK